MVTYRERRPKPVRQATAIDPPFNADEFLALDNRPAEEALPDELFSAARTRRISISSSDEKFDPREELRRVKETGEWELELPAGSGLVVPGREGGRISPEDVTAGIKRGVVTRGALEPFMPKWTAFEPHPKVTTESRAIMRRADGRPVEPHYGVFGADNRQVYYPSGYPWICVGKILVWNDASKAYPAWSGSGVLVGGRVVLTAGHVAPWGAKSWAMQFIPSFYDGDSALGRGVSSWVSDYWGYNTGNQVSAWDMVVLRLYTPLGNSYGYFGTKDYNSSWEDGNYWTLAGYPGAVAGGNRPSRQMWWPVLDDDGSGNAEEIEYEADATAGNSGGPVFGFWSGLPYAIATHSGGSKTTFLWWTIEDTNVGAGGGALNSLVAWARSTWP